MTPLQKLVVKDEIMEMLARYTLLLDGDNLTRDPAKWGELLFTPDATFQSIGPFGELLNAPGDGLIGRATIAKRFGGAQAGPRLGRHYPVNVVFDEITPTTVRTRSTVAIWSGQRGSEAVVAQSPALIVYHDTWRKQDGVWKKAKSDLHFTTQVGSRLPSPVPPPAAPPANGPAQAASGAQRGANRHFPIDIAFDELTPTTAKTRTTTIIMSGQANSADPTRPLSNSALVVYHDAWRKEGGVWRKAKSELRYSTFRRPFSGGADNGKDTPPPPPPVLAKVGAGMTTVGILAAKQAIREQFAQYTLILDGDGLEHCGTDRFAPALFTKDATFQSIAPDGSLLHGPTGMVGRTAVSKTYGGGEEPFPACRGDAVPKKAAGAPLTGLDALLAKDAIREQNALYSMFLDGDGVRMKDPKAWSEIFTASATFQSIGADGAPLLGPDAGLAGRDVIQKAFAGPPADLATAGRWFLVNTAFDSLSRDEAYTRTTAFRISGPSGLGQPKPATAPIEVVFHDHWRHDAGGWKKVSSVVR